MTISLVALTMREVAILFLKLGTAIVMIMAPMATAIINSSNVKPDMFCLVDMSFPFQSVHAYLMKEIILAARPADFELVHT